MTETPKRRWFSFRLRTLLVVVAALSVLLTWVKYSRNWIRHRDQVFPERAVVMAIFPSQARPAPGGLGILGEVGVGGFGVCKVHGRNGYALEDCRRYFPESSVGSLDCHCYFDQWKQQWVEPF